MTAIFIITSKIKTPQSLNRRHLVFPAPESTQWWTALSSVRAGLWWDGLVNQLSWEGPVQNCVILTGISEQPDLRKGILKQGLKKTRCGFFYHYRMDVYTHFQHTFMFKQLVKWILHPMTPLKQQHTVANTNSLLLIISLNRYFCW